MFSLFSRKGAAKSRDPEGRALGLLYLEALHEFELQAFTCYSVGLFIKSRAAFAFPAKAHAHILRALRHLTTSILRSDRLRAFMQN